MNCENHEKHEKCEKRCEKHEKTRLFKARLKIIGCMVVDAFFMLLGVFGAVILDFNSDNFENALRLFGWTAPVLALLTAVIFYFFGIYSVIWRYANAKDVYKMAVAAAVVVTVYYGMHALLSSVSFTKNMVTTFKLGTYAIGAVFALALLALNRLISRHHGENGFSQNKKKKERLLIIGGGDAGAMIIRGVVCEKNSNYTIAGVIDDDPAKLGLLVYGAKVLGNRQDIPAICSRMHVDTILFCISACKMSERVAILNICAQTGCVVKVLPGVTQLIDGRVDQSLLRKVEIEDILERAPIRIDNDQIHELIRNRVVLVTGGGGSIGSELCRQLAADAPKELIIFDIYENNAYAIQNELRRKYPNLNLTVLIGSVRDENRLAAVFEKHRPNIVFHAAAHKHVPLMEDSPLEAIKNNVFGTLNTVRTADRYGVDRFVLISTDKAVNPTNVMGATKRLCEMIIQTYNQQSKTDFAAVRFGNVLGSNGSVVPLFKEQIAAGGPVTVTHPDIIRYFMTIPEAVSLVLQAGALAKGGEIFVLDMGKPVRILDMAEKLIRLSGYVPYEDIKIQFVGLRPGEKLYEELLMDEEGLSGTENELIHIGRPIALGEDFLERLARLGEFVAKEDDTGIRREIGALVPTYHPKTEGSESIHK